MPAPDPWFRPEPPRGPRRPDHLQLIHPRTPLPPPPPGPWPRPDPPRGPRRPAPPQLPPPPPPSPPPPLPLTGTECPICQGAGFLRAAVPVGHPQFGTLLACECRLPQQASQDAAR